MQQSHYKYEAKKTATRTQDKPYNVDCIRGKKMFHSALA